MTIPALPTPDNAGQSSGLTVSQLVSAFTAHQTILVRNGQAAPKTLSWYVGRMKHLKLVGDLPAAALRVHHLEAIDLTNAFVRVLKRLYKWAVEEDLVAKDPFTKFKVPPCGQRERVLKREELARLYRVAARPFRRLLFVQLHTLARPGEIRQLTWGQIDFEKRLIILTKFKGQKARKDKQKVRPIPLSKLVYRMLLNMRRKSPDQSPEGRVFRSIRYGKPWTPNGVRCAMRVARGRAGLNGGGERIVCYSLRHTGATEAIRSNVNIKVVAEMMGHSTTKTTEKYLHLDTDDLVGASDQIFTRRPVRDARPVKVPDDSLPSTSA